MARRRMRMRAVRRFQRGSRKLIWLTTIDAAALFTADGAGDVSDTVILVAADDWKIVNTNANEKATLVRTIIHETSFLVTGTTLVDMPFVTRMLHVGDEGGSPLGTITGTTISDADVLYTDQLSWPLFVPDNHSENYTRPVIDSRVKRRLESNEELLFSFHANTGYTGVGTAGGVRRRLLARMLVSID